MVSNTPGGPVKACTAEQTWALILAGAKHLAAADVFATEPLPASDLLLALPHVTISPHLG
ncbi:MAG: hypothetical protein K0B16_13725, partial [Burkholderiaceae bacterium]|nr:hypothetical protein [Burkholderiaceae bacterium]